MLYERHDIPAAQNRRLTILLAEDHEVVRQGLKALLEREGFSVVAEARDGREAVLLAGQFQPDLALLDLILPKLNGLDAAREIPEASPRTQTVLLTMHTDDHYIIEALRSGIRGYVLKSQAVADLVEAIQEVRAGRIYLSPLICQAVAQACLGRVKLLDELLKSKERQILQLIAEGRTTKEIAATLGISLKNAESNRTRIMDKLNIHDTAGLVRYAIRHGLIKA